MVYEFLLIKVTHHAISETDDERARVQMVHKTLSGVAILATCRQLNDEAGKILKPKLEIMSTEPVRILFGPSEYLIESVLKIIHDLYRTVKNSTTTNDDRALLPQLKWMCIPPVFRDYAPPRIASLKLFHREKAIDILHIPDGSTSADHATSQALVLTVQLRFYLEDYFRRLLSVQSMLERTVERCTTNCAVTASPEDIFGYYDHEKYGELTLNDHVMKHEE